MAIGDERSVSGCGKCGKTHKMVKMQESLEGDKDCNIGKLQEILERAEIRHTLEDLGIYSMHLSIRT